MLVAQLCLILWDPWTCSPAGSSVHKILQAKILEWVAISFSRGSSQAWNQLQVSRNYSCFKFPVSDYQHPCHIWVWFWFLLSSNCAFLLFIKSCKNFFDSRHDVLTSFCFGQTLLRRTECSDVFQNGYFYSLPAGSKRGFVSNSHHEILVELLEVKLKKVWGLPYDWHSLKFLTLTLAYIAAAAAAAKSLQSCPTLWDPIDGNPPGSAVPGILQASLNI